MLSLVLFGEILKMAKKVLQLPLYEEQSDKLIEVLNYNLQIIEERLQAIEAALGLNQ